MYIAIYFIIANILAFILMYIDKRRAVLHKYRIPERTLMFIGNIGGSLGIFIAMHTLYHKLSKARFKYGIPAIMLLQGIFLYLIMKI